MESTTREDEIYKETHEYFDQFRPRIKNIDRLSLIHFRLENTGLDLLEALLIWETRKSKVDEGVNLTSLLEPLLDKND